MTMDETSTVTFLFSDVEGSTALLRRLRDRYRAVIEDHNRLLRGAWTDAGGRELDSDGDSFFVVFRRPRQAVEAAVAAQRALAEHEWPDGVELKVRIGIHTGEAHLRDGDYYGSAVNLASRVGELAVPREILATAEAASAAARDRFRFEPAGRRILKGFDAPVALYAVARA